MQVRPARGDGGRVRGGPGLRVRAPLRLVPDPPEQPGPVPDLPHPVQPCRHAAAGRRPVPEVHPAGGEGAGILHDGLCVCPTNIGIAMSTLTLGGDASGS